MSIPRAAISATPSNEWYTPEHLVDAARQTMGGIDFDPASCAVANEVVQATRYMTIDDDALRQDWPAGRTWVNPPYSGRGVMAAWAAKIIASSAGRTMCVITLASPSTGWWHELVRAAVATCFLRARPRFWGPALGASRGPGFGCTVFYFGQDHHAFRREFGELGLIMTQEGEHA
jgi:ParB family transcriptional regulator, chromosome partitioning protein